MARFQESDVVLDGGEYVLLEDSPASDHEGSGIIISSTVSGNATGIGAALYMNSGGEYEEANASGTSTMPCTALALESGTGTKDTLLLGYMRDDTWDWTPGGILYVSTVNGAMTQTLISGSGEQAQIVGYAVSADRIYFNPTPILGEVE